jgi:hypothetical protein
MRLPRGTLSDPLFDESDLAGFELIVGLGRRHDLIGVFADEALVERAFIGLAAHHGRTALGVKETGFGIEAETSFAGAWVRAVAMETGLCQDGADIAVEGEVCARREQADAGPKQSEEEKVEVGLHDDLFRIRVSGLKSHGEFGAG